MRDATHGNALNWPRGISSRLPLRRMRAVTLIVSAVTMSACGGGGGGGVGNSSVPMTVSMSGTAATGKALSNALVTINCARGNVSTSTDVNGAFGASFMATFPCLITATSGATQLHSVAFTNGTFNVTPETELMLAYLAAQMGTNITGLLAGLTSSATIEQVLGNVGDIQNAETVVVQSLDQSEHLTLTTAAFLTQSFVVGQAGEDADLEMLKTAGAIDTNGEPVSSVMTTITTAGAAHPIAISPATVSGGSGGQAGGVGGMGGGMM